MLWSMIANVGSYVMVSTLTRQSVAEQAQAARFVDVYRRSGALEPGVADVDGVVGG